VRGLIKKAITAVIISVITVIIIAASLNIEISEILTIGLVPFCLSASFATLALVVKGIRFYLLANGYQKDLRISLRESIIVRIASEFVALISVSFVGDEAFRFGWLAKRGINSGKALWIAYAEVLFDVLIGTIIAIVTSIILLLLGNLMLGIVIGIISASILLTHLLIVILSGRKGITVPKMIRELIKRLFKQKGESIIESIQNTLRNFSETARMVFRRSYSSYKLLALSAVTTIIVALLHGASLCVLLNAIGVQIDILASMLIVYATFTLAALPITIGGSGLAEIGTALISSSFAAINTWSVALAWRITNYHVQLAVSAPLLIKVLWSLEASSSSSERKYSRS